MAKETSTTADAIEADIEGLITALRDAQYWETVDKCANGMVAFLNFENDVGDEWTYGPHLSVFFEDVDEPVARFDLLSLLPQWVDGWRAGGRPDGAVDHVALNNLKRFISDLQKLLAELSTVAVDK